MCENKTLKLLNNLIFYGLQQNEMF